MIISPDFIAYEQKYAAASALRADALPLNKSALFDALAAADIQIVVMEFDGCGDSGQLENITGLGAENVSRITLSDVLLTSEFDVLPSSASRWL